MKNNNIKNERFNALNKILDFDEKTVIYLYYGFHTQKDLSLSQVAKFIGKSRYEVSKILNKSIQKLQNDPNVKKYFEGFSEVYMKYSKGERVRHPKMSEWGIGQVLSDSEKSVVKVFFSVAGEKAISLEHIHLVKLNGREAKCKILDQIKSKKIIKADSKGKKLCKNCGQPTQFQERTDSRRYDLGWCVPCFSYGQAPFEDKKTGKRPYFDELRTVDGIRKRPGSVQYK